MFSPTKFDEFYWKYLLKDEIKQAKPEVIVRVRGAQMYRDIKAMLQDILTYDQRQEYFGEGDGSQ